MPIALSWRVSMASLMGQSPSQTLRLPELVEMARDRNKARSCVDRSRYGSSRDGRRLDPGGKLLKVHCANCRPERHIHFNPEILRLPRAKKFFSADVECVNPSPSSRADGTIRGGAGGGNRTMRRRADAG
jgi:hypothetical protein